MKNQIDLIGEFSTQWIRYSSYELKENEQGSVYIIPSQDATFTLYNPFEVANTMIFDLLSLGEASLENKDIEDEVLDFVEKYGLLGLAESSVYNRDIIGEDKVLLLKNNFITKESVMDSWDYVKYFLPFADEDDVTLRKYKNDVAVIKSEDSPKFYGKRPLILDVIFSKFYGERLEWFLAFAKNLAEHFNQLNIYKNSNLTEPVTILAGKFKAEKIGMSISMYKKPILTWEVDSLKTVIELVYGFAVTDPNTILSRCTYCQKIYVAKSDREKYCSPSCRNCANVIKSRNKKKSLEKGDVEDMERKKELIYAYKERTITGGVYRIVNKVTGQYYLDKAIDLKGSQNRFNFSVSTGSCVVHKLQKPWKEYGKDNFEFEILEEIEKKPEQSDKEFKDDLEVLKKIWGEKLDISKSY